MTIQLDIIDKYLAEVWDRRGTDLLLTVGASPMARLDGQLVPISDEGVLTDSDLDAIMRALVTTEVFQRLHESRELDLSFEWEGKARFRGNAFYQRGSLALALRVIPNEIPSFDELGLPSTVQTLATLPQGLVLFTGPTGAGKSTTQASLIDWINRNRRCHILTIEDPIEYVHEHRLSAVNQREIGDDTMSFAKALRSALREDPDVLLVGEMRDIESIQTTLTIAETGHLVFATLHTNDAAQSIDRIIDVFPSERQPQIRVQLSGSLGAVVSQRLLPQIGGGQVAAFEVLVANRAVRNLVKEGKSHQLRNVILTGQSDGMQTLEMSMADLVARGLVTQDDAVSQSLYPNEVKLGAPQSAAQALSDLQGAMAGR
jgi:twitching motility protein PilT